MFVERFMAWTVSASVEQRSEAICLLVKKYLENSIVADDRPGTEQVFTLYLNDPSVQVRASMARSLAQSSTIPRTLIWSLMQDVNEVAVEVYSAVGGLKKAELIHGIERNNTLIQCAIAKRKNLDGDVVRALVDKAREEAILSLLNNQSVVLGPVLKHELATRLGSEPSIRAHLLAEADLLPKTRQMLVERLTGSLLSLVSNKGWTEGSWVSDSAHDASNRVSIEIAEAADNASMGEYVEHLRDTAQLTPALLVRAICVGNAALFENAISVLSGASLKRVQSIVDEGRISAFRALYGRTKLPQSAYGVFAAAITTWQKSGLDGADNVLMKIIDQVEQDESVDGALLALLGRMAVEFERGKAASYQRQLLLSAA